MSFPTLNGNHKVEESSGGTTHQINGFAGAQSGDAVYALFATKKTASGLSVSGPGSVSWSQIDFQNSASNNDNLTVVRAYCILSSADASNIVLTTPASQLAVGLAVLIRGARDQSGELLGPDKAEMFSSFANNPGLMVTPGASDVGAQDRAPDRSTDGSPHADAKLISGFGRAGRTSFNTTINDPIGSGLSDGAPYWADREKDQNWVGEQPPPDGACPTPMAVVDHAESDDGTWKLQVAMAHLDIASAGWSGHPNWSPYIFQGQVGVTYWPINTNTQSPVPTLCTGFRARV